MEKLSKEELYKKFKSTLLPTSKRDLDTCDSTIAEIARLFSLEDWYLINEGRQGIARQDGETLCFLPLIQDLGFYPIRDDRANPTYSELKATSFYLRNREKLEQLYESLFFKDRMIKEKMFAAKPEFKQQADSLATYLAETMCSKKTDKEEVEKQESKIGIRW